MGNACFKEDQKAKYSATQPPDDPGLNFFTTLLLTQSTIWRKLRIPREMIKLLLSTGRLLPIVGAYYGLCKVEAAYK